MFRSPGLTLSYLSVACLLVLTLTAGHVRAEDKEPGMLGVTLRDDFGRVLIKNVHVGGPAYAAGLRPGDRIIAVGHKAVNSSEELINVLAESGANDRVEIYASRNGWMKDLPIKLGSREQVAHLPLMQRPPETPRAPAARSVPVQAPPPKVHHSPFHRQRYERW